MTNDPDPLDHETNIDVRTVYGVLADTPVWFVTCEDFIYGVGETKELALEDAEEWLEDEYSKYLGEWHADDHGKTNEPLEIVHWISSTFDLKRGTRRLARQVEEHGGDAPYALNDDRLLDILD
jgi:hypothetical protein